MKVAVLGAAGLLGARVCEELVIAGHEIQSVTRREVDLAHRSSVLRLIDRQRIDCVVNCAGVVKSRTESVEMALVNSGLPRWIAETGVDLVHVSTDCVYSGERGFYSELDEPDPVDLYGATKVAGEVFEPNTTVVRTSFIGWGSQGLLHWLLQQKNVLGFQQALWSGLSAREVARALCLVVDQGPSGYKIYHLSGRIISKYRLLCLLKQYLKLDVEITPVDEPVIDRSLDGRRFIEAFGYSPPDWNVMAEELAGDR